MKETWKFIVLLAIAIGTLLAYAFLPETVSEKLFIKQMELDAICENNTKAVADSMAAIADNTKEETDTTHQRILLIGDSMTGPMALRFSDWANKNGHEFTCVTWVSSSTSGWASCDTIEHYMNSVHPTHVFVCMGSNELYSVDEKGCKRRIQTILKKIGNVPTVWIGPPNWCEDNGYNKWLFEILGAKCYYPSYKLTFTRQNDGRHPDQKSSNMWVDKIMEWMNSGKSIHPFVMVKPDKQDRHFKQVTILPPGTKRAGTTNEDDIEDDSESTAEQQTSTNGNDAMTDEHPKAETKKKDEQSKTESKKKDEPTPASAKAKSSAKEKEE